MGGSGSRGNAREMKRSRITQMAVPRPTSTPKNRKNFEYNAVRLGEVLTEASYKSFKNEKFYEVTTYGYDKYFLIPGGGDLNVDDESLEDIVGEGEVTGRRLKTAFLKMNRNRLTNRVLLSKTIDCLV